MSAGAQFLHIPVLEKEVLSWLMPALEPSGSSADGGVAFVDATVGGGGHALAFLTAHPTLKVLGIDRDGDAIRASRERLGGFGGRITLAHAPFSELEALVEELVDEPVKGILFDLGVSSPQFDVAERGFGFRSDAPLDMRMDRSRGIDAETVVNTYSESELGRIIATFGEERFARRIARTIVTARGRKPIASTAELADIVRSAIPAPARRKGPHPARRTFQALRIEVNRELDELNEALPQAIDALAPSGRLAVIAYHSLEDRIVKRTFRDSPHLQVLTKKPVRPTREEVEANRRSDSARLRVAIKVDAARGKVDSVEGEVEAAGDRAGGGRKGKAA